MTNPSRITRAFHRLDLLFQRRAQRRDLEEILEAGDFRVDLHNHQAAVRGERLYLNPAEFDLLVFLIKHPRRIVSPRTLLATRWGGDHIRQTEFLPLLLGLRKKLETAGLPSHYLRTESWVFYRFETTRETSAAHDVMANKTA